jgi:hypothetical protein
MLSATPARCVSHRVTAFWLENFILTVAHGDVREAPSIKEDHRAKRPGGSLFRLNTRNGLLALHHIADLCEK